MSNPRAEQAARGAAGGGQGSSGFSEREVPGGHCRRVLQAGVAGGCCRWVWQVGSSRRGFRREGRMGPGDRQPQWPLGFTLM